MNTPEATGFLHKKFNGRTIISISHQINTVMDLDWAMALTTVQYLRYVRY